MSEHVVLFAFKLFLIHAYFTHSGFVLSVYKTQACTKKQSITLIYFYNVKIMSSLYRLVCQKEPHPDFQELRAGKTFALILNCVRTRQRLTQS